MGQNSSQGECEVLSLQSLLPLLRKSHMVSGKDKSPPTSRMPAVSSAHPVLTRVSPLEADTVEEHVAHLDNEVLSDSDLEDDDIFQTPPRKAADPAVIATASAAKAVSTARQRTAELDTFMRKQRAEALRQKSALEEAKSQSRAIAKCISARSRSQEMLSGVVVAHASSNDSGPQLVIVDQVHWSIYARDENVMPKVPHCARFEKRRRYGYHDRPQESGLEGPCTKPKVTCSL